MPQACEAERLYRPRLIDWEARRRLSSRSLQDHGAAGRRGFSLTAINWCTSVPTPALEGEHARPIFCLCTMPLTRLARQSLRDPASVVITVFLALATVYLAFRWPMATALLGFPLIAIVARVVVLSEKRTRRGQRSR